MKTKELKISPIKRPGFKKEVIVPGGKIDFVNGNSPVSNTIIKSIKLLGYLEYKRRGKQ